MTDNRRGEVDPLAEVGSWPVYVRLNGREGYALYITGEERDHLWGDGHTVWLFPSLQTLASSVLRADTEASMHAPRTDDDSFASSIVGLRAALEAAPDLLDPGDTPDYDLTFALNVLERDEPPQRTAIAPTVNAINMLWDIGLSTGLERQVREAFEAGSPLRELVDEWTFLEPGAEASVDVGHMHKAAVVFRQLLDMVMPRIVTGVA